MRSMICHGHRYGSGLASPSIAGRRLTAPPPHRWPHLVVLAVAVLATSAWLLTAPTQAWLAGGTQAGVTVSTAARFAPDVSPQRIAVEVDPSETERDEPVTVTATVTGQDGEPIEGEMVDFSIPGEWEIAHSEVATTAEGTAGTTVTYTGRGTPKQPVSAAADDGVLTDRTFIDVIRSTSAATGDDDVGDEDADPDGDDADDGDGGTEGQDADEPDGPDDDEGGEVAADADEAVAGDAADADAG